MTKGREAFAMGRLRLQTVEAMLLEALDNILKGA
eukprot:CAMPEP_0206480850 /NCGR_PEP_ID=MMETSP0324_2-20121206/37700_1 /ASSEMBLY_ACC=CAM_ASM_000836 /TAXON_ID=2866 /ORGANISM="Crypthecodinium cohnii, Strain Seligo" /LENGTH=33 /DNA_ID= /DNA_START= /DNA_END= /DNA_ORIENTATION=